jgi:spore coat protein U-like protein
MSPRRSPHRSEPESYCARRIHEKGAPIVTHDGRTAVSVKHALYRDTARTLNWGNVATGSTLGVVGGLGAGAARSIPIYECVPPQTTRRQGAYSDSVVVTVSF